MTTLAPPREARADWRVWNLDASLVVTDAERLEEASQIAEAVLDQVDLACSRFRPDSEVLRIAEAHRDGDEVSPLLATLVRAALDAAEWTSGDVDPTLGGAIAALGYDRDLREVRRQAGPDGVRISQTVLPGRVAAWRSIRLDGRRLTVPPGLALDLGATAKAVAADLVAGRVADELGVGVLVALGGDIATAGERGAPWQVRVQDRTGEPAEQVSLEPGSAIATSSTLHRRWLADGRWMHHILDPRSGLPAAETWRTATVAAPTCLEANALSTAAIVRGRAAGTLLTSAGVAARLVDSSGRIHRFGGWPDQESIREGAVDVR